MTLLAPLPATINHFIADHGTKIEQVRSGLHADLIIIGEGRTVTPDSVTALFRLLMPGGRIACSCRQAEPFCSNGKVRLEGTATASGYRRTDDTPREEAESSENLCIFTLI